VPPESPPPPSYAETRREGPGHRDYSTTVYLDAEPWDVVQALIKVPADARLIQVRARELAVTLVFQVPPPPPRPPVSPYAQRPGWIPLDT